MRVFLPAFFILSVSLCSAQKAEPSGVDKAFFFLTKFNVKKYSTTIHPNFLTVELGAIENSNLLSLQYEPRLKTFPFGSLSGQFGFGNTTRLDDNQGIRIREGALFEAGINYLETKAYHHFMAGTGILLASDGGDPIFFPYALLGYRFHNPTTRLSLKGGIRIVPSTRVNSIIPFIGLSYAFGKR